MRRTASEKMEIIRLVEGTDLPVRLTLRQMGVPRSTFYDGYQRIAFVDVPTGPAMWELLEPTRADAAGPAATQHEEACSGAQGVLELDRATIVTADMAGLRVRRLGGRTGDAAASSRKLSGIAPKLSSALRRAAGR